MIARDDEHLCPWLSSAALGYLAVVVTLHVPIGVVEEYSASPRLRRAYPGTPRTPRTPRTRAPATAPRLARPGAGGSHSARGDGGGYRSLRVGQYTGPLHRTVKLASQQTNKHDDYY